MYYVCVENGRIISTLNYEPNAPESVKVFPISDEEQALITEAKTHYFDIIESKVKSIPQNDLDAEAARDEQIKLNAQNQNFLRSTDWQVLRHIRERELGQPTSLSATEYTDLEKKRSEAAAAIKQV